MATHKFIVSAEDQQWIDRYGWKSVSDVLNCASDDVAAVSRSSDVVHVSIDSAMGGPESVFVKRYLYNRRSQRIKQMFRGTLFGKSRARTEYEFLQEMCSRRVPTVRPISYGEVRKGAFLRESFIITEGMEGVQSLDMFALNARQNKTVNRETKNSIILGLAEIVRRMHQAGVQHGGLYWRNILLRQQAGCGYEFWMLDPDSSGKLYDSSVPLAGIVSDLSHFMASAMSLDARGGLGRFMRAYLQVSRLEDKHRQLIARVLQSAKDLASQERRRMAVTEAIDWFRGRVSLAQQQSEEIRSYATLEEFFDVLGSSEVVSSDAANKKLVIHFSFSDVEDSGGKGQHCLLMDKGRVAVGSSSDSRPDMTIRTDSQTWLSVISGRPDAYARLRAGRLRMQGDTKYLHFLVKHIDEVSRSARPNSV